MRDNIQKVNERGENLNDLQGKTGTWLVRGWVDESLTDLFSTDNLAVSAQGFRRGANRVRKQMWWKVGTAREPILPSQTTGNLTTAPFPVYRT